MRDNEEIEKVIQKILLHELGLPETYGTENGKIIPSVYIVSPLISQGSTDKLQIAIQSIGSKVVGNNVRYNPDNQFEEIKECVVNDMIQVDIKSRNNDARIRRFEVLTSLASTYAKQMQEYYQCRIFNIPSGFSNTQAAEGATLINRYTITFSVEYLQTYKKEVDYYDKFSLNGRVDSKEKQFNQKWGNVL
jgi:hypothetical protein